MHKKHASRISRVARKPGPKTLSVTSLLCAAGSLSAQTAAPSKLNPQVEEIPTDMPEVVIEAAGSVYNPNRLQSPKYTEPLRDIPQTITIIPKALIEDRGAFSLRDVLKNTPGIAMAAGELIAPSCGGRRSRSQSAADNGARRRRSRDPCRQSARRAR